MARRPAPATGSPDGAGEPPARGRGGRLEEVRAAAIELFARDGYSGTNMTDIARELQLGAPSLYNHIASKGELLREICVFALDDLLAVQKAAMKKGSPADQLRVMTEGHVTYSATHQREITVTAREFIHLQGPARQEVIDLRHRYERGFRTVILNGTKDGEFEVAHPKLASYAIIEMGLAVATWYRERGQLSVASVAEDYGEFARRLVGRETDD